MRRCGSVILFLLFAGLVFAGIFYYAEMRARQKRQEVQPEERLEIYTDLPQSALQIFDRPYYKEFGVGLSITEMTPAQIVENAEKGAELKGLSLEPAPKPAPRGGRRDHRWKRAGWTPRRR